jgi:hypothetical protein
MELTAELARRLLKIQGLEGCFGVVRVEQQSNDGSVGNELKPGAPVSSLRGCYRTG